jgi:predicted cupin superfamily sugar epimerase
MHARAKDLIALLRLEPHPEGGFFRRVFRSERSVTRAAGGEARSALTTIHYLLVEGSYSRWHRVASDEAWHFLEGDALGLFVCPPSAHHMERITLGPAAATVQPVYVVPADYWQAARSLGAYSLLGCSVGPGFDFADFTLASDLPAEENELRERLRGFGEFG